MGLEGVTGRRPRPVDAGWDPLGGAGASRICWRGLGVDRSIVWVEGVSEVAGAGLPSLPTSMAFS